MRMWRCLAGIVLGVFYLGYIIYAETITEKRAAMVFAWNLGSGINMGNSLDVTGIRQYHPDAELMEWETGWRNPAISREQFQAIRNAGFGVVRIPVSWEEHVQEDGIIRQEFMDRVKEVVDMALECDLYVIINTHHEKWLNLDLQEKEYVKERLAVIWEQIAAGFQGYGENLLFEGLNEPRLRESEYEWNEGTPELRDFVNELNETFVKTVRNAGGTHKDRYLLICPYCNCANETALMHLKLPDDDRLMVSVHLYQPTEFCHDPDGPRDWNSDGTELEKSFDLLNRYFLLNNVPVVITEFGCIDKNNIEERVRWTEAFMRLSRAYQIPCLWWDNGGSYQLLNRQTGEWIHPDIVWTLTNFER